MEQKQKEMLFGGYLKLAYDEFENVFNSRETYHRFIGKSVKEKVEFYERHKTHVLS
jgi:hypothetical protein